MEVSIGQSGFVLLATQATALMQLRLEAGVSFITKSAELPGSRISEHPRLTLNQYQEEGRNAVVMVAHARSTAIWLDWRVPFPVTCLLTPSKRSADEFEKPRWTARVRLLGIAPTEYRVYSSTTKYTYITTTTTIPPHHVRTLRGTGLQQTGLLGQASRSHLRGGSCKASQLCARSSSMSCKHAL